MKRALLPAALSLLVLPGLAAAQLEDLQVRGDVRVVETDNGRIRERVELVVRFNLGPEAAIEPMFEDLTIQLHDVRNKRNMIVSIPAGAFEPANNGYQLISADPAISGVTHTLVDLDGLAARDLTPKLRSFDARLVESDVEVGQWRLVIDAVTRSGNGEKWQQAASASGTEVALGDDSGLVSVRGASFRHR